MLDKESSVLYQFRNHSVSSGGDIYIPMQKLDTFIDVCQKSEAVIFSVELFRILDGKIIPYVEIISIDSSQNFDNNVEWNSNLKRCNGHIVYCYEKISKDITDLYFSAVIEFKKV